LIKGGAEALKEYRVPALKQGEKENTSHQGKKERGLTQHWSLFSFQDGGRNRRTN